MVLTSGTITDVTNDVQDFLLADWTHYAVGDGTTTPVAGDTALDNETFEAAIDETDDSVSDEATFTGIIGAASNNGNDIKEVGVKDASSGDLKLRKLITTISKTSDIIVYLDFTVELTVEEI